MNIAPATMDKLKVIAAEQVCPLLFATVSGAHLYGFPSPNSDFDLRGVHLLPLKDVVGMRERRETIEITKIQDGLELDLVTHDAEKFFKLMLRKNGYVLEQLYSPLVVFTRPEHAELKDIADSCITRHHVHHYLGFSKTQWELFQKENPHRVKPLLYVYRVLLTGIHLMRTGKIEANLVTLNQEFKLKYLDDLVAKKLSGDENSAADAIDMRFHEKEYQRLRTLLESEGEKSQLPEAPSAEPRLNDLLIRLRLEKRA